MKFDSGGAVRFEIYGKQRRVLERRTVVVVDVCRRCASQLDYESAGHGGLQSECGQSHFTVLGSI